MASLLLILLLAASCAVCSLAGNTCGGVSPLTRWARTARNDTIQMNIDTSGCRFETTPLYFTSVSGLAGHYLLVGVSAIYEATSSSFHIDVRSLDRQTSDTLMAWSAEYQWNINWMGFLP